jgi:hypothetical protein
MIEIRKRGKHTMKDGEIATLTESCKYYSRRYLNENEKVVIVYYGLDKKKVSLARAVCQKCKFVMESKTCGDYVPCLCGASFVDTDRWFPERHRFGGDAVIEHKLKKAPLTKKKKGVK